MSGGWTPGPWWVEGEVVCAPDGDNFPWYVAIAERCGYPNDQSRANAHLIAAAPELYEALEALSEHFTQVVKAFRVDSEEHETLVAARAALAKARGE